MGWAILTLTELEGDKEVEVRALKVDVMVGDEGISQKGVGVRKGSKKVVDICT